MDLPDRPCPNAEELTVVSRDGTTTTRSLRCPVRGILALSFATTGVRPTQPVWVGPPGSCGCPIEGSRDEAGFAKGPNPSPVPVKKVAQDLMDAAENADLRATIEAAAAHAHFDTAGILPAPVDRAVTVQLPELPDGVTVEVAALTVARGESHVTIQNAIAPDLGWYAVYVHRKPGRGGDGSLPFYGDFIQQRHATAGEAVAAAVAYLDALNAWSAAVEEAHAALRGVLGVQ